MSFAVLFPGQASQHADMLPWLDTEPACSPALSLMTAHLGADWRQQLQNPGIRDNNGFAQVLITGTALAAWSAIQQHLPLAPTVVAGYSVGELSAIGCAGVLTVAQAIELAALRAQVMDQAVAHLHTGLLSVTGSTEENVLSACASLALECAIRVSPQHNLFAGSDADLKQALLQLTASGAQATRLAVGVASHSSWMTSAALAFAKTLEKLTFTAPPCLVGLNASGELSRQPAQLRRALWQQLACTVQWSSVMNAVAERQVSCVLEVGGGSALSRMWNEQHPQIPARALDDFHHPQGAVDWVRKTCANDQ